MSRRDREQRPCGYALGSCGKSLDDGTHTSYADIDHAPSLECHPYKEPYCNGCDMDARQAITRPHEPWCSNYYAGGAADNNTAGCTATLDGRRCSLHDSHNEHGTDHVARKPGRGTLIWSDDDV